MAHLLARAGRRVRQHVASQCIRMDVVHRSVFAEMLTLLRLHPRRSNKKSTLSPESQFLIFSEMVESLFLIS